MDETQESPAWPACRVSDVSGIRFATTMSRSLAVVTGGASGLGKIIAWSLHRQGWHVAIADRDQDAGVALADQVKIAAGRCTFIRVDISDEKELRRLFDQLATLGHVRLLVNNAGGWLPGATVPGHRRLAPQPRPQPQNAHAGRPTGTAAHASRRRRDQHLVLRWLGLCCHGSPEYAVAKAGLIRFTTAVADFAERFGVRVSCVVPHWIGLPRAVAEFDQMDAEARARAAASSTPKWSLTPCWNWRTTATALDGSS